MSSYFADPARRRKLLLLAFVSAFSLSGYLLASHCLYRLGFPLDDAWIHQTYARNVGLRGEWAFLPGRPSAGSTAPLWSVLLALGHTIHLGPYIWTYFIGWLILLAVALVGMYAFSFLCPQRRTAELWVGLFLVFEWHLVWAAGSGMETLLIALLALSVLALVAAGNRSWFKLGALIGLSIWIRPDGLTLIGPALFALILEPGTTSKPVSWADRLKDVARLLFGVGCFMIPYLLFNQLLAGAWWPNTFFAKQAEYASHRLFPLWERLISQAGLPLIGAGALLLPGFVYQVIRLICNRAWGGLAGALWMLGYLCIYAWRLPVTYQHGRYVMPAMPVYFVWGLAGMIEMIQLNSSSTWKRVFSRAWVLSTALVTILFWLVGARAYARDVAIIESEMVTAARWLASNSPDDALVAAHDIGALGYFSQRQLIDLAGLVSPEVIPFIRDEPRLAQFLEARQADYLVTFPEWYPGLVQQGRLIFSTQGEFSPMLGGENMAIYQWEPP
jgi:hypothetical protein